MIGQRTRDHAAKMCSARASAEAAGIRLYPRRYKSGHVFEPGRWTKREQKLGHAAFLSVIADGADPREMAANWGEAEARLRTGEYPTPDVDRVPQTRPTRAQKRERDRRRSRKRPRSYNQPRN